MIYIASFFHNRCAWGVILLLLPTAHLAMAQSPVRIAGHVVDRETKEAVPYVHVYTTSFSQGTVTDENGKFQISMASADTLVFSAVGFDKYFFSLKQDDIRSYYDVVIELDFKTYELEPVKVIAYRDLEQFKKAVLELNIPAEKSMTVDVPKAVNKDIGTGLPTMTIRGPITALYNALSKEGRELKRLEAYRKERSSVKSIGEKYNTDMVKRVTNLSDEGARRFMEWCKFEDDFILRSTEYELTVAVLKCLDDFVKKDSVN